MKKVIAVVLCLAVLFTLSVSAFAVESSVQGDGTQHRVIMRRGIGVSGFSAGNSTTVIDDGDTIAEYSFGEDGKIVTFSFEKEQITLFWISHGTLEDIGGLGLTFSIENITPKGCTVICQQSDGYVSGEIIADKSFDLMMFSGDSWGWSGLIGNKTDNVVIQKESNTEWVLDWSQYSENLRLGRYYLCFQVRDVRSKGGDWDSYQYRVELQINAE